MLYLVSKQFIKKLITIEMQKDLKQTAKLIKADFTSAINIDVLAYIKNEVPKNGKKFTLHELQSFVGGLIEILPTANKDFLLVCNEESKCVDEYVVNKTATKLYAYGSHDEIAGDVLLVHKSLIA